MLGQKPASLFESFSGHVNTNNYRAFQGQDLRNSVRTTKGEESQNTTMNPSLVLTTSDKPVFDRSLSLLEFTIQS